MVVSSTSDLDLESSFYTSLYEAIIFYNRDSSSEAYIAAPFIISAGTLA
jgi:hypothetical protein